MGKYQRTKGHNFERETAKQFRELFPEAKRGFQTRGGGKEAADVEIPFFHIECKVGKRPNPLAAYKQASEDATNKIPVAIIKRDREKALVVFELDVFIKILTLLSDESRLDSIG